MNLARFWYSVALAGFAIAGTGGIASAQTGDVPVPAAPACDGTACTAKPCTTCGHGGLKPSPTLDHRYIKQYCYPVIVPGSCFGHFPTRWTPWPCQPWPGGEIVAPAPSPAPEKPRTPPPTRN